MQFDNVDRDPVWMRNDDRYPSILGMVVAPRDLAP